MTPEERIERFNQRFKVGSEVFVKVRAVNGSIQMDNVRIISAARLVDGLPMVEVERLGLVSLEKVRGYA